MGHNLDFVNLLGLPEEIKCKNCNNLIRSSFEEYDIDCGGPEAVVNKGLLTLSVVCEICEHYEEYTFETKEVRND